MVNINQAKLQAYLDSFVGLFKDKRHKRIFNETIHGILVSHSLFPPQDSPLPQSSLRLVLLPG